jgi:arabinose-5-phosphate isomerase
MNFQSKTKLLARAKEIVLNEADAISKIHDQIPAKQLVIVLKMLLRCQGHVLVTGIGTSFAVAHRFAHLLSCCGTPAILINPTDCMHGGSGAITSRDIVFVISKGGESIEITQLARIAKLRGAKTIWLTSNHSSLLSSISDAQLSVNIDERLDPYGLIAVGSSLMNSVVCDLLCILLLELRGFSIQEFALTHPGGAVGKKMQLRVKK